MSVSEALLCIRHCEGHCRRWQRWGLRKTEKWPWAHSGFSSSKLGCPSGITERRVLVLPFLILLLFLSLVSPLPRVLPPTHICNTYEDQQCVVALKFTEMPQEYISLCCPHCTQKELEIKRIQSLDREADPCDSKAFAPKPSFVFSCFFREPGSPGSPCQQVPTVVK